MRTRTFLAAGVAIVLLTLLAAVGCGGDESAEESATPEGKQMAGSDAPRTPPPGKNHLAFEKSPYLLQHADNPVEWYPWGEEAFALAQARNKPIFLSIGYSTCHWCHVMEHESFEDEEVAALMNDAFVCIKVDREERPDVDQIYMTVCQMMTGSGGWPLTIVMTPDRRPFFAGTYLPRASMLSLIPRVTEVWETQRQEIDTEAGRVVEALQQATAVERGNALSEEILRKAASQLEARYDSTWGGFGARPKFPTPHNLTFLLRWWKRAGDENALAMVEKTLERMRMGGMYDHIGFGFHRYSTDERWFLPHFEKMLYDQALLAIAYTEAWQATGRDDFRRTAEEIFTYVLRDMSDERGGFYSAEDADSEGEEGKFYLWSASELRDVLGPDADLAIEVFGASDAGNYSEEATGEAKGVNILYLERPISEVARVHSLSEDELRTRLESIRSKLFEVREARVHPHKDDKVLADWNGLMIAALSVAGRAFGNDEYIKRAERAARFVTTAMATPDGGLLHRYRDGEASIGGMVDDYAFMTWGLLELYEAGFDVEWLRRAIGYTDYLIEHFWDGESGGFFFTAAGDDDLIIRPRESYDGAVPSGNSVAMLNLLRIGRMTADSKREQRAMDTGRAFETIVSATPAGHTHMMLAVDFAVGPSFEIVIAGKRGADDARRMLRRLHEQYVPRKVVLFRPDGDSDAIVEIAPYTKEQASLDGRATAYVCRNYACQLPTADPEKMLGMLTSQ